MKKLYLVLIVLLLAAKSFGQGFVVCEPKQGYSQTRALSTDSSSFYSPFVFDIPEGVRTDTLHLMVYVESSAYGGGDVDLNIHSQFGFKKAGGTVRDIAYYAWFPDSTQIVDALALADTAFAYLVVHHGNDTLANGTLTSMAWSDAVRINIQSGGTANAADVDFWIKLVGTKDNDK